MTVTDRNRTEDLDKLADAFFENLERGDCEYGGWGLDDKRPFGNSSVGLDILELLGWETDSDEEYDEAEDYAHAIYDDLGDHLRARWKALRRIAKATWQACVEADEEA